MNKQECNCPLLDRQIINAGAGSYSTTKHWHCPVHGMQHREYEKPEMFKSQEERVIADWPHKIEMATPIPLPPKSEAQGESWKYQLGDEVRKIKGSEWEGYVCGFYSTSLTERGYAVESIAYKGTVQIYPEAALELIK